MHPSEDRRLVDDVVTGLRSALDQGRRAGAAGADSLGSGAERAVRALVARRVARALRVAPAVPDTSALARALEPTGTAASLAGRAGTVGRRLARRSRFARTVTGRSPAGLALRWGPLAVDIVRSNLRSVDAVASHLVSRARRAGVEPDPDLVRVVVVQALTGSPLDPTADVDHTKLAQAWLRDSGRRLLPLGSSSGDRRPTTAEVVGALADFDVGRLSR